MIHIHLARQEANGERIDQGGREASTVEALRLLIQAELAFGATITEVSATRLALETQIFDFVDLTAFSGSPEEMRPLHEAVALYLEAADREDLVSDGIIAQLQRLPQGQGFVPRVLSMVAPMVLGRARLALAFMIPMGVTNELELRAGVTMPLADLVAAFELVEETGLSFAQVLEATQA